MFPKIMPVQYIIRQLTLRIQPQCFPCHFRHGFQNHRMINGFCCITSPGKGAVISYNDTGHCKDLLSPRLHRFNDHTPGIFLIRSFHFLTAEASRTRHGP